MVVGGREGGGSASGGGGFNKPTVSLFESSVCLLNRVMTDYEIYKYSYVYYSFREINKEPCPRRLQSATINVIGSSLTSYIITICDSVLLCQI